MLCCKGSFDVLLSAMPSRTSVKRKIMLNRVDLKAPGLLPDKVRAWVFALAQWANVSFEFALMTLLSAMSAALAGLRQVRRPDGGIEPVTLFVFGLAPPAYGKTRVFKRAFAMHLEEDADRLLHYMHACEESDGDTDENGTRRRGKRGPRLRSVLLQDVSRYGLAEQLHGVGETVAIATHEGNLVLRSNLFQKHGLEMATSTWDGDNAVQVRRGHGARLIAVGSTMPILVLVQPDIFEEFRALHGKHALGVGFFDRTLFIDATLEGVVSPTVPSVNAECLEEFDACARSFLQRARDRATLASSRSTQGRDDLVLSPQAAEAYGSYVQRSRTPNFLIGHLRGAIDRSMQNVLRIAGLLQEFSDEGTPISAQCIDAAHAVVSSCLLEAAQLFPPEIRRIELAVTKLSPQERRRQRLADDAQEILRVTRDLLQLRGGLSVALSEVRERCAIYPMRFRAALAWLTDTGQVTVAGEAKRERISVLPESSFGAELRALQVGRNR